MQDFLKNFSLEGKVAWITGASYGLGLAYAVAFAESGAKIVFNDINQDLVQPSWTLQSISLQQPSRYQLRSHP